jgi:hypothetical protein
MSIIAGLVLERVDSVSVIGRSANEVRNSFWFYTKK